MTLVPPIPGSRCRASSLGLSWARRPIVCETLRPRPTSRAADLGECLPVATVAVMSWPFRTLHASPLHTSATWNDEAVDFEAVREAASSAGQTFSRHVKDLCPGT